MASPGFYFAKSRIYFGRRNHSIVDRWCYPAFYHTHHVASQIATLLNDIQVIDCTHPTVVNAVNSDIDDLEDALQYYAALAHKIDYFISSDKKLKKTAIPSLPIYADSEWVRIPAGPIDA